MVADRIKVDPLSDWEIQTLKTLRHWFFRGIPNDGEVKPVKGKHHLTPGELRFSLDKLAQFCMKDFVYGPIDVASWKLKEPHEVGTFATYQKVTLKER